MSTKRIFKKAILKQEVPVVLEEEFGISQRLSLGMIESVNIASLSIPENSDIEVRLLDPKEKSGLTNRAGDDITGKTKKSILVESTKTNKSKFVFVLQHENRNDNLLWTVTGDKQV